MTTESAAIRVGGGGTPVKHRVLAVRNQALSKGSARIYIALDGGARLYGGVAVGANTPAVVDPPRAALAAVGRGGGA